MCLLAARPAVPYNVSVLVSGRPPFWFALGCGLLLSMTVSSCGTGCAQGPTTTCWCPGEVAGTSSCGENGQYGACICPGSPALTPVPVVPTAVLVAPAPPPPPPRPGLMLPAPMPMGLDSPTATTGERDASIAAWLMGPVRGRDNRSAAIRAVTISGSVGAYQIHVSNQFGFRCALSFDAAGNPSAMTGCRSHEAGWSAEPDPIPVRCEVRDGDVRCEAPYQLRTQAGFASGETFLFLRRVARVAPIEQPPSDGVLDPWAD